MEYSYLKGPAEFWSEHTETLDDISSTAGQKSQQELVSLYARMMPFQ